MIKKLLKTILATTLLTSIIAMSTTPVITDCITIITLHQQQLLNKYEVNIIIEDKIEDTHNWGFSPAGLYNWNDNILTLESDYVNYAINHEYSHFIDDINGRISDTEDFLFIYYLEKDNFKDPIEEYARSSSVEYFACVGKQYIEEPNKLEQNCPKTFEFFEGLKIK